MRRLVGASTLVLAVACGEVVADPSGATIAFSDQAVDGGVIAFAERPSTVSVPCRLDRPEGLCGEDEGDEQGEVCEYGESPDRQCNVTMACRDLFWHELPADTCWRGTCPSAATVADLDGKPCSLVGGGAQDAGDAAIGTVADEALCQVAEGICACTTGAGGAQVHARRWVCVTPLPGCPAARPWIGQPCAVEAAFCDYGSCASKRGIAMQCVSSVWQATTAPCSR